MTVYLRVANCFAFIVLSPQRRRGGVAIVALSYKSSGQKRREKDGSTRTDDFLRLLVGRGLRATLTVFVAHALRPRTLVLREVSSSACAHNHVEAAHSTHQLVVQAADIAVELVVEPATPQGGTAVRALGLALPGAEFVLVVG